MKHRRSHSRSGRSKSRVGGRRRYRHRRAGRGKLGDWIRNAAGKVKGFLQKTKLISKVAPVIAGAVPGLGGTIAGKIGSIAAAHGYGRRRRRGSRKGNGMRRFRSRHRGRGYTPGMGLVNPTTYPIATSTALPRF